MPRYLIIPEQIVLLDDNDKPVQTLDEKKTQPTQQEMQMGARPIFRDSDPETFWSWLKSFVLRDKKFNEGFDSWERITRLKQACKDVKPGVEVALDEDDWKLLVDVIKVPTQSLYRDGLIASQFMPYIQLVLGLKTKKTGKVKKAAAKKAAAANDSQVAN